MADRAGVCGFPVLPLDTSISLMQYLLNDRAHQSRLAHLRALRHLIAFRQQLAEIRESLVMEQGNGLEKPQILTSKRNVNHCGMFQLKYYVS